MDKVDSSREKSHDYRSRDLGVTKSKNKNSNNFLSKTKNLSNKKRKVNP